MEQATKERLITDVKSVLSDTEDLLKAAAASSGEKAVELRERALTSLKRAKEKVQDVQDVVVEKSKAAVRATDDYVHDHPWRSVSVALGAGFLLGLIINRK